MIKVGWICSFILHILLILCLIIGIPNNLRKVFPEENIFLVELVNIADLSNLDIQINNKELSLEKNQVKNIVKASDQQLKPIQNQPSKQSVVDHQTAEQKLSEVSDKSLTKQDNSQLESNKQKEIIKDNKVINPAASNNDLKTEPKKELSVKKQDLDLESLLKSLEDSADEKTKDAKKNQNTTQEKLNNKNGKKSKFDPSLKLSISETDNIRQQIHKVWNIPAGAKALAGVKLSVKGKITKDGEIIIASIKLINDKINKEIEQALVNSIRRALKRASPLQNLPLEKYQDWNEFDFIFTVPEA